MRSYVVTIDVVDNGYYMTFEEAVAHDQKTVHRQVYLTSYLLSQAIDKLLPRPAGQPVPGKDTETE